MRPVQTVAIVATFSAMIVGSDFALASVPNVKLLDSLVFVAAFVFGFRIGAYVGILSEVTWSFVSPIGMAGAITPFLVGGELLFAVAGWWASRVWGDKSKLLTPNSMFIGALMLVCAFVWDFETNAATALIVSWPALTIEKIALYEGYGIPFALVHEGADFLLGVLVAPATILLIPKMMRGRE